MKSEYSKSGVRLRDPKYLAFIRGCSCLWASLVDIAGPCGGDVVPAHGKVWGRGIKGEDSKALPMCFTHHNKTHAGTIKIYPEARQKLVDALNQAYCKQNNITLKELRGK